METLCFLLLASISAFTQPSAPARAAALETLASGSLTFVENRGQLDPRVVASVAGRGRSLFFTPDSVMLALDAPADERTAGGPRRWAIELLFDGCNPGVHPVGEDAAPTIRSWFRGPREQWITGVPAYSKLVYRELWPGVDLEFRCVANQVKYAFVVKPGADPGAIGFRVRGASATLEDGALQLACPFGTIDDGAPIAWEEHDATTRPVATRFALEQQGAGATVHFAIGARDPSRTLVIDPAVTLVCGFIGGNGADIARGVAVDANGIIHVAGNTESSAATFPEVAGPDFTYGGGDFGDGFVARVSADGTTLLSCGYLGGSKLDILAGLGADAAGNSYVCGYTDGSPSFPLVAGPDLTPYYESGGLDCFVARVAANGLALDYCGFVCGDDSDERCYGLAVASDGTAWIVGRTASTAGTFPTGNGPTRIPSGSHDAFVARISPGGALTMGSYLGGPESDEAYAIALDDLGNAFVVGGSESESFPLFGSPVTQGSTGRDAWIAKLVVGVGDTVGLAWYSFIGGNATDIAYAVTPDGAGGAFYGGISYSSQGFPVLVGPSLTYGGGIADGFLVALDANGVRRWSGYIGGAAHDQVLALHAGPEGTVWVAGSTSAAANAFPVTEGPALNGDSDGFIAQVAANGTSVPFARFFGGAGGDTIRALDVDATGNLFIAGDTGSAEDSFPEIAGPDLTANGGGDAFVAEIVPDALPPPAVTLKLALKKGLLKNGAKAQQDKFKLSGSYSFTAAALDLAFKPASESLVIEYANLSAPLAIAVPAGSAGWKSKGSKLTWKTAPSVAPKVKIVIDTQAKTFSVNVKKLDFATAPVNPLGLRVTFGNDFGAKTATWSPKPGGMFTLP